MILDLKTKAKLYKVQELMNVLRFKVCEDKPISKGIVLKDLDTITFKLDAIITTIKNTKVKKDKQNKYLRYLAFIKNKKNRKQ